MINKVFNKLAAIKIPKLKKYYLYYRNPNKFIEFELKLKEVNIKVIKDIETFSELLKLGYKFSIISKENIGIFFANNCTAICIFRNYDLGHISWMTSDIKGKKLVDPSALAMDKNSIFWGTAYTKPCYRGMGYSRLALLECFKMCKTSEIPRLIWSVQTINKAAINSYNKFEPITYGVGYAINIFWYNLRYIKKLEYKYE